MRRAQVRRSPGAVAIGENPGRLVNGCAQGIESGLISRIKMEPCHGSGENSLALAHKRHNFAVAHRGHAQRFVELCADAQIGAQELRRRTHWANRGGGQGTAAHSSSLALGDCAQTDVEGAGILPSALRNPLGRSGAGVVSANLTEQFIGRTVWMLDSPPARSPVSPTSEDCTRWTRNLVSFSNRVA